MAENGYSVGVVGATGAVGSTILEVLAQRDFPAREVVPFASERSAGKRVEFDGQDLEIRPLTADAVDGLDLVLSSAGGAVSAEWAPRFADAGAVVVDNTSYWRMHEDVPLVVAGVNDEAADDNRGIVANPNSTTMQKVEELRTQARAVLEGERPEPEVFPHQVAFNVLPQVETFKDGDDYTTEERKVIAETRKILGDEKIPVSPTCVRVPVHAG